MAKEAVFIVLILSAVIGSYVSVAQVTITPSDQIVTLVGTNVTVVCRETSAINYCRIEDPTGRGYSLQPGAVSNGIEYFGRGLQSGECGVSINPVKEEHNGRWQCSFTKSSSVNEVQGLFNITVAKMPERPKLVPTEISGAEQEIRDLRCTVTGSRPPANIEWFIGNETWASIQGLNYAFNPNTPSVFHEAGSDLYTTEQNVTVELNYQLHGKPIRCVASVPTLEASIGEYNELAAETRVTVTFRPKPLPGTIQQFDVQIGSETQVTLNISSNPRPQTQWTIEGVTVYEGTNADTYSAQTPMEVQGMPGTWEVVLVINPLSEQDIKSEIRMSAENDAGREEYRIQLNSGPAPATAGLGIGAIIGIVIAVLFVFILIFLCIFARATGRWCFAAGRTERESSDTESADRDAPKKNKKSKLPNVRKGISYLKKGKNEKDMTDAESLKKLDKDRPGNDKIVYAELNLANSDNAPRKEAEKTEYAEIIGTVKLPHPESPNKI